MKIEEMKKKALIHLETYAELITKTSETCIRTNFMLMAAGAIGILEDLQIIDNETAEEFRKKYINWGDV